MNDLSPGTARDLTQLSRRLTYVLRHSPESIGVALDEHGWVGVDVLLRQLRAHGTVMSEDELQQLVATNDKQRFVIEAGRIRAQQGHSVAVDLALEPATPPPVLWHGTVARSLPGIFERGLTPGARTHVHLSPDQATATRVGARRGRPVLIAVDAAGAHAAGAEFFLSGNGVWLTATIEPAFLRVDTALDLHTSGMHTGGSPTLRSAP